MMEHEKQKPHGWDRFLYNMYMLLTFPVRRWWVILGVIATVLLVLIIIPTLDGVKKENIIDWYKTKFEHSEVNKAKNKTIALIGNKIKKFKNNVKEILPGSSYTQKDEAETEENKPQLVSWNVAAFRKAKYVSKNKEKEENKENKEEDSEIKNTINMIKEHLTNKSKETEKNVYNKTEKTPEVYSEEVSEEGISRYYIVRTDLNLEYLDEPETISGAATVSGPNELYVGDNFVYLYGIYTSPRKYNVNEVKNFLENAVYNQTVECDVVAYSTQTHAKTALCFVNGVLINKQMVIEDLADNVALKMN